MTNVSRAEDGAGERWTVERAQAWYAARDWPVGFNYAPRYAINQLEMWQRDTFDPDVIDEELGWASDMGFNMVRVFLHNLLWEKDRRGFLRRVDRFLSTADSHHIAVMFVLFDDVWDPSPRLGPQRSPIPHTHNSGWVQAPGKDILGDIDRHDELEDYVRGIVRRYGQDLRVAVWDLYNEPSNDNVGSYYEDLDHKGHYSLQLIKKAFHWARLEDPTQPLTSAVWRMGEEDWAGADRKHPAHGLYRFMTENSDVLTFHSYSGPERTAQAIAALEPFGRPTICTEYMARSAGSTFEAIMPLFVEKNIGAIHWGFVSGKTQTIYPWRSWREPFMTEPDPWFHDVLRADGSPYRQEEVDFLRDLIAVKHGEKE